MCLSFHYKYFVICIIFFFLLLHILFYSKLVTSLKFLFPHFHVFSCCYIRFGIKPLNLKVSVSCSWICYFAKCFFALATISRSCWLQGCKFISQTASKKWNQIFKEQQIQFVEDFYHILVILFSCCWRRKTFLRLLNFWFIFFFYRIWRIVCTLMAMNSRKEITYNVKL